MMVPGIKPPGASHHCRPVIADQAD